MATMIEFDSSLPVAVAVVTECDQNKDENDQSCPGEHDTTDITVLAPDWPIPRRRIDRQWLHQLVRAHPPQHNGSVTPSSSPPFISVLAPMVDQSDLPFRLLCRHYGCQVAVTPMVHAKLFCTDVNYRRKFALTKNRHDRPLIAQICGGSDPLLVLQCALQLQPYCDAIDINCGCPQSIAKRGLYGAFLLEQEEMLLTLVHMLVTNLSVPVSVKVRLLLKNQPQPQQPKVPSETSDTVASAAESDIWASLQLYRKLVQAGISLLTIHGRSRLNKGRDITRADWAAIKIVVDDLGSHIPIIANGSIASYDDAVQCWQETNADGIMSAEAILEYPPLFCPNNQNNRIGRVALTRHYLQLARQYPPQCFGQGSGLKCVRMHCHRLLHADLQHYASIRRQIVQAINIDELESAVQALQQLHDSKQHDVQTEELSWYRRHTMPTIIHSANDDDDHEDAVVISGHLQLQRESSVKYVELADDAADCFANLFG